MNNTWGRIFDSYGQPIIASACPADINLVLPDTPLNRGDDDPTLVPSLKMTKLAGENELADLVRFLTELGKPGPFDVGHAPVARQWLALSSLPPEFSSLDPDALGRALADDAHLTWVRGYSDVAGELPLAEYATGPAAQAAISRCRFNITVAGKCGLSLNSDQGVRLWLDGRPLSPASIGSLDLAIGFHTFDFSVDLSTRKLSSLRCELLDVPGSSAHAQWAPPR